MPAQGPVVAQPVSSPITAAPSGPNASPKPSAKRTNSRCWLFGACGTAIGAILLAVILFLAGVLSSDSPKIESPGFDTPEDAAKAYLVGLRNQDIDAMLSAFAVESYVDNYDLEGIIVEKYRSYLPTMDIRLPNSSAYNRQLNIAARRERLMAQIADQYLFYSAPYALNERMPTAFQSSGEASHFFRKFERDTKDYVFADLKIGNVLDPEDVSDRYMSSGNPESIAELTKTLGADKVTNIVIAFEADGRDWLFCPQAVRYNGKWYLHSMQGLLANLLEISFYCGGIAQVDTLELP